MANLNKVMLIGRLTRDPEMHSFQNGGRVANFGFAVNNRKKNQSTGQWEDDPVFVDCKAFNRETGRKLADLVEQYLKKGHQAYIEGRLTLEKWQGQDGSNRQMLRVIVEEVQFLEPRTDGGNAEGGSRPIRSGSAPARPAANMSRGNGPAPVHDEEPEPMDAPPAHGGQEEDIPF